jgi:RsiW-degrading membrane proteinase PrsW (M82 family)
MFYLQNAPVNQPLPCVILESISDTTIALFVYLCLYLLLTHMKGNGDAETQGFVEANLQITTCAPQVIHQNVP